MKELEKFKSEIVEALNNLTRYADYKNKAGRFDVNKDAEEFYRGLLNLFFGWNLKNANAEALVLYFFEFCFIGKKTKENPQKSLFDEC